jgi:hypothetical protein
LTVLKGIVRYLQRHFEVRVTTIAVRGITNTFYHEHSILSLVVLIAVDIYKILGEIPRSTEDFILNEFSYFLFGQIPLFLAIFITGVRNLGCF